MRETARNWLAPTLIILAMLGFVIAWIAVDWELLVGATFALALMTAWMAYSTRDMATASREEAEATKRALAVARETAEAAHSQAEAANQSLLASIQPVLTRLVLRQSDRGVDRVQLEQFPNRATAFEHEHLARVQVQHGKGFNEVFVSVPFRNVGVGPALVRNAIVELNGHSWKHEHVTNTIIQPGERTRVSFAFPPYPDVDQHLRSFHVRVQYQNIYGTGRRWTVAEIRRHDIAEEFQVDRIILEDEMGRVFSTIATRLDSDP